MTFPYHKTLVVGATSGIGRSLAARIATTTPSAHVIASGRRKENLDALVAEHSGQVSGMQLDLANTASLAGFVAELTKAHPDLDCVVLNAGMQRGHNFQEPETVDLDLFREELLTNYTNFVVLTHMFVSYFLKHKERPAALIYTSSNLATVPLARVPGYSGSKAAQHAFAMALREQLRDTNVKVQEIMPPIVQTEIHDAKHQRDYKKPAYPGMPLEDFTDEAFKGLVNGEECVIVQGFDRQKEFEDWRAAWVKKLWELTGRK